MHIHRTRYDEKGHTHPGAIFVLFSLRFGPFLCVFVLFSLGFGFLWFLSASVFILGEK